MPCSTLVNRILVYNNTDLPVLSRPTTHLTTIDAVVELTTDQWRLVVTIERARLNQKYDTCCCTNYIHIPGFILWSQQWPKPGENLRTGITQNV